MEGNVEGGSHVSLGAWTSVHTASMPMRCVERLISNVTCKIQTMGVKQEFTVSPLFTLSETLSRGRCGLCGRVLDSLLSL